MVYLQAILSGLMFELITDKQTREIAKYILYTKTELSNKESLFTSQTTHVLSDIVCQSNCQKKCSNTRFAQTTCRVKSPYVVTTMSNGREYNFISDSFQFLRTCACNKEISSLQQGKRHGVYVLAKPSIAIDCFRNQSRPKCRRERARLAGTEAATNARSQSLSNNKPWCKINVD